jgi:hypothetical protein
VQLAQVGSSIGPAVLDAGAIYFTANGALEKLVLATSAITVLVSGGLGAYGGKSLAVHAGTAYIDQQDMGQYPAIILAVPTDGGGAAVDTCAGGFMSVAAIVADDTTLYWGLIYEADGTILSKPR